MVRPGRNEEEMELKFARSLRERDERRGEHWRWRWWIEVDRGKCIWGVPEAYIAFLQPKTSRNGFAISK